MTKPFLVVVTGLSGAGRSVALKSLEDIGFYCMDNLPISLLPSALEFIQNHESNELFAIGPDTRNAKTATVLKDLKKNYADKIDLDFIFLTADENSIIRRFSTTRRKHPLLDGSGQLIAAIRRENDELQDLEALSDVTFDTSQWSPHFLARQLEERLKTRTPGRHLHVTFTSFGFKYGMLRPCDMLIDVRFLKNPYFDDGLKSANGLDIKVQEYVQSDPDYDEYFRKLFDYMMFVLPRYLAEGKNYFRMGIGCTGGQHRSVTIAEKLSVALSNKIESNILLSVHHRDLPISS